MEETTYTPVTPQVSQSPKKTRNTANAQVWRDTIAEWRESGKSQVAFCREHSLGRSTFQYWKRNLESGRSPSGKVSLIRVGEVTVGKARKEVMGRNSEPISLMVNGRYRLEIGERFEIGTLKRLLDVLEGR
jgi:transposase-like protein